MDDPFRGKYFFGENGLRGDGGNRVRCPVCSIMLSTRELLRNHMRNSHYEDLTQEEFETKWDEIERTLVSQPLERADATGAATPASLQNSGAEQNLLCNITTTATLSSLLPRLFGSTNPTQLTVSPASTEFNYLSASSTSSQQQSTFFVSPQLQNNIQQFLINAPQLSTGTFAVLGLNQPAPIVSHQQNPGSNVTVENNDWLTKAIADFLTTQNFLLNNSVGQINASPAVHSTPSPSIAPPPRPPPSPAPRGSHNPYHCPSCPKSFLTKKDFYSHINAKHPAKRIKCPKCTKYTFSTLSFFEKHLESKHSGDMGGEEVEKCRRLLRQNITRLEQEERFLCPRCRKSYKSSFFRVHLKQKHPEMANSSDSDEPEYGRRQFQGSQSSISDNNPESTNYTVQPYNLPSYTGFDDLTASTSQQQTPSMPVPLGDEYPESPNASQQNLDGNPPHGSSQSDCSSSQLISTGSFPVLGLNQPDPDFSQQQTQQFLASNMSGLLNAPQQAPNIQQPLGLNTPGSSDAPQQPLDIIQALLSNRNNLTTTQLESIIQQLFASNIPGMPNAPQQAPWIQQPLGLNIPGPSNAPQQSTGIAQALEMIQQQNIAGAPPPGSHSLPVFMRIPHPVEYEISRFQQLSAPNTQGVANPPQQAPWIQQPLGLNIPGSSNAPQQYNYPTASTSQQRSDESNVPGTSSGASQSAPGTSSGKQESSLSKRPKR